MAQISTKKEVAKHDDVEQYQQKTIIQTTPKDILLGMVLLVCFIIVSAICINSYYSSQNNSSISNVIQYYNYATVEWERLDSIYRPYVADWSEDIDQRIHSDFPQDIAAEYWRRLQNAKTHFHQQAMPLRATAPQEVLESLDRAEAAFDTVFVRCVEQEYYMRLFVDVYNETLPPALDSLCLHLNRATQNRK